MLKDMMLAVVRNAPVVLLAVDRFLNNRRPHNSQQSIVNDRTQPIFSFPFFVDCSPPTAIFKHGPKNVLRVTVKFHEARFSRFVMLMIYAVTELFILPER